jgi:hypothetical protein
MASAGGRDDDDDDDDDDDFGEGHFHRWQPGESTTFTMANPLR